MNLARVILLTAILCTTPPLLAEPPNPDSGAPAQLIPDDEPVLKTVPVDLTSKPLPLTAPLIELDGVTLSVAAVRALLLLVPQSDIALSAERGTALLSQDGAAVVGRRLAVLQDIGKVGLEKGLRLTTEENEAVRKSVERIFAAHLMERSVEGEVEPPTELELKRVYEETSSTLFKKDPEIKMRAIFLSTYVPHFVGEGETLESIAREVSGDEKSASQVLTGDTMLPRSSDKKPLRVGEKLLVPGGSTVRAQVKSRIEDIEARLKLGEDFVQLADLYSENPRKSDISLINPSAVPLSKPLFEAFMALEDGEFSAPIENRHGFQIIQRLSCDLSEVQTFETALPRLAGIWIARLKEQREGVFFAKLAHSENLVSIVAREDSADADPVVAKIGDVEVRLTQVAAGTGDKSEEDDESLRSRIGLTKGLRDALFQAGVVAEMQAEPKLVADLERVLSTELIAQRFLEEFVKHEKSNISEEEVQEYWGAHLDRYVMPTSWNLYGIAVPFDDALPAEERPTAAVTALKDRVAEVKSLQDFQVLATRLNDPRDRRFLRGGSMVRVQPSELGPNALKAVEQCPVGEMTEVVVDEGECRVFWVVQEHAGRNLTPENSRPIIEADLRGELGKSLIHDLLTTTEPKTTATVLRGLDP